MLSISHQIETRIRMALKKIIAESESSVTSSISGFLLDPQLVPATKPEFGDFQVNCALALAKPMRRPPREIALAVKEQLANDDQFLELCELPQIAGPGFINITLRSQCLISEFQARLKDARLGVPLVDSDKTLKDNLRVVVDFSSPNIAKEMHVGHLRSTIIGDCLARVLEFRGYSVSRLNHVGDWGTQFGMLITHLKKVAPSALETPDAVDLGNLVTFYREAKHRFDTDKAFQEDSRQEVVKLQMGDEISLQAWSLLCTQSRKEFQSIYDRLDIRLHERGESFYNPYLQEVVEDLDNHGLLVVDDGAKCVFLEGLIGKDGKPLPVIVQKRDGGFNYSTTDLAAIRFRFQPIPKGDGACRVIYVTDVGQSNHFAGVFQVAKRAGWIPSNRSVEHVPFGLVQGEDGKKLKTRSGDTVRLRDLLDEAVERAEQDLCRRLKVEGRNEDAAFISKVSSTVGLAAVKYADLSQNRITNYQFSFDRMLSLQGNTAPYLLYALVRISGIYRKGGKCRMTSEDLKFSEPQEWTLLRELLKFDQVVVLVEKELLPNRLCNYLFELSQIFNRFYDQVPVLKAEEHQRVSRLALCRLTADTLRLGMSLLGIPTLERM
ncbi:arginine--tRNA ligase [Prochlorococcus sp. MIT 1341]|uniref:arginine--tRNA ligase n=1 Tax=Prochlorococcus sp. MIT 1341 TaxID=3096221 RepID=UPI002A765160|nr:arginine--tRNA ligase [Prochlorococcus sp. MIT 1341]